METLSAPTSVAEAKSIGATSQPTLTPEQLAVLRDELRNEIQAELTSVGATATKEATITLTPKQLAALQDKLRNEIRAELTSVGAKATKEATDAYGLLDLKGGK